MKTAEEFIKEGVEGYSLRDVIDNMEDEDIIHTIIEFTKYHVKNSLESAYIKAKLSINNYTDSVYLEDEYEGNGVTVEIDKESILNSYNLDNIK